MYLEYWGLKKHAFNNTPDPGMYFPMHATVENAVAELVFAIEEGDECLAVVVGEVGLGKTMSLRVTLDSINQDKYRIAFVTNPDLTFPQLLREIIGQLTTETCTIKSKDALLERFNQLLFETVDEGKRVVIFIDEGNAIRRLNLQSLRLLTNMQEDDRNLFTMIIAGQPELGKNLERPEMANLFQRIGVYCKLKKMESEEVVKDYIEHRLERAGRKEKVFSDQAFHLVWKYSENGVPRLVNRICKLALKAGETNNLEIIDADVIHQIGERFARADDEEILTLHKPKKVDAMQPQEVINVEQQVIDETRSLQKPNEIDEKKLEEVIDAEQQELKVEDIKIVEEKEIEEALDNIQPIKTSPKPLKKSDNRSSASIVKDILNRMKDRHRETRSTNLFFR